MNTPTVKPNDPQKTGRVASWSRPEEFRDNGPICPDYPAEKIQAKRDNQRPDAPKLYGSGKNPDAKGRSLRQPDTTKESDVTE